jgi:hypothetical protein
MNYHNRVGEFEDDESSNWVPLGVAETYEINLQASRILHEAGIESIWGHDDGSIDELRSVLEFWPESGQIHVEQINFEQALALVGSSLSKPVEWASLGDYLASRPTEDLFKIIDLRDSWKNEVICETEALLKKRGASYPPDGVNSRLLPTVCLIMSIWLGIFAAILRWRINKTTRPATGGSRPYYSRKTRRRAEMMLSLGFRIWLSFLIAATIFKLFSL